MEEFRFRRLISRKCWNEFAHVAAKTMTSILTALTRVRKSTIISFYVRLLWCADSGRTPGTVMSIDLVTSREEGSYRLLSCFETFFML